MPQARYNNDLSLPYWLVRGRDTLISVNVYDALTGDPPTITAASMTLLDDSGAVIVTAAAVPAGNGASDTILIADLPAVTALSARWLVRWGLTIGGIVYDIENPAHVVRREPLSPVIAADLQARHQVLRTIKTRDKTNGRLLADAINITFETVLRRIISAGRDPERIMAGANIFDIIAWGAMSQAFLDAASSLNSSGQLGELGAFYDRKFEKAWNTLKLDYDRDGDGVVAADERNKTGAPVLFAGVKRWRG